MIVQHVHFGDSICFLYYENNKDVKRTFRLFNAHNFHFRQCSIGLIIASLKSLLVSVKMQAML